MSLVLAAVAMVATVAIPWLTGRAVDEITDGDRSGLSTLALLIGACALVRLVLSVARRLVAGRVSLAVEVDLRNLVYAHLQTLELGFFATTQTGQLMSRATVDLQAVRFFLGYGLVFIVQSALTILLAAGAMLALQPELGALALAPVPFVVLVAARYSRRSRPSLQEVQQRIAELTADVEENVSGVRVVKAFAAEPRRLEQFRGTVTRVFDQSMDATRLRAFYNPFIGFLPNLGLAVILLVGGRQVINGTLTLGDFTAFYAYLLMLIGPMRQLGIALSLAQRASASGARLFELLDREPRLTQPEDAQPLPPGDRARGAARRDVRILTRRPAHAAGRVARRRGRLDDRAGRRHGLGQVDARAADLAALRPRLGVRAGGRRRRPRARPGRAAARDRGRRRRPVPVLRHGRGEHRLRPPGRLPRGHRGRRPPRAGLRVHRRPARWPGHPRRRARAHALGRPAAAAGDRARAAGRPADPGARRRDLQRGRLDRAGDQGRAARGDDRADDVRDRPPAVDDLAGRRGRGARGRADRRARHPRRAGRATTRCTPRSHRRACPDPVPEQRRVAGL